MQRLNLMLYAQPFRQRGQSMVFALVFMAVVLIGVLVLFNTGQLTRQKMEVQNAADAAAYSAALLTARELNFMAYTNRAMVANEITFGQFSAFDAWSKKYKLGAQGRTSGLVMLNFLGLSPIATGVKGAMTFYNNVNISASTIPLLIRKAIDPILTAFQYAYAGHQNIMRTITQITQMELIPRIIDQNAKGATLSNFGALALLLSSSEQQTRFLNMPTSKTDTFKSKIKRKNTFTRNDAKRRFAAFVNASRDNDQWLSDRSRDDVYVDIDVTIPIVPSILEMTIDVSSGFLMYGGSELRLVSNSAAKQETYGWSHLDTTDFELAGGIGFALYNPTTGDKIGQESVSIGDYIPITRFSLAGASQESNEKDGRKLKFREWEDGDYGGTIDETRIASIEAVIGGNQKAKSYSGLPFYTDIDPTRYAATDKAPIILVGVRKNSHKLRTSDRIDDKPTSLTTGELAVNTPLPGGPSSYEGEPGRVIAGHINNQVDQIVEEYRQKLLDSYDDPTGLSAPIVDRIIDSFRQRLTDTITNELSPVFNSLLAPIDAANSQGGMFALAAARVYFQNPNDGEESELGNTFSPYWKVRLQPVDENVRKWAVLTQTLDSDSATGDLLQTTTPDPDSSGITPDSYTGKGLPLAVP